MELLKRQFHYALSNYLMDYGASKVNGTIFVIEMMKVTMLNMFGLYL